MNTLLKQTLTASVLSTMLAGTVFAQPAEAPPVFVKRVADQLISRLKADQNKLQNPTVVKNIVRENLDPYIDAQSFSRVVMGTYATNQYSTPAQRALFTKNLRESLIETYGPAFADYSGQTYSLRPYKPVAGPNPIVAVDFNNKGQKIPVIFQLSESGTSWKIRNINVSNINIGLQFRNQFAATVKRNGGNMDKAIATFKPVAETDDKAKK